MRQSARDLVRMVHNLIKVERPICELGSFQVQPPELSDVRRILGSDSYIGMDMRQGRGVNLVGDVHRLPLASGSVGTLLCLDTLEHVQRPWLAVDELERVLRPGGMLLLVTVMKFPIHEHPHDYWRFTPQAIKSLIEACPSFYFSTFQSGARLFPHTVGALAWKEAPPPIDLDELVDCLSIWSAKWASVDEAG